MLGPWSVTVLVVVLGGFGYSFTRARATPVPKSAMVALAIGWMYSPSGFFLDLPVLPPLFPESIFAVGLMAGLIAQRFSLLSAGRTLPALLFLWLMLGASRLGTAITNGDPLVWGPKTIQGMRPFDAVTGMGADMAELVVPFGIGLAIYRTRKGALQALTALATVALPYVFLILYELKMAPILQRQVFGYRPPMLFSQSVRDGGYRPQVFFSHGLSLGIAWLVILLAIAVLYRLRRPRIWRFSTTMVLGVFAAILVLIKAKAALAMGLVTVPMVLWAKPKRLVQAGMVVAVVSFVYPMLHLTGSFPHEQILGYLAPFGEDRLESMAFRFDNEAILAERAGERQWFGWGGYGRDRIYDERTGRTLVIQDGHWIITLGLRGLFGYVIYYGLVCLPLVVAWWRFGRLKDQRDQILVGGFVIMLTVLVFNSIPNMALRVIPQVLSGAILSLTASLPLADRKARAQRRKEADERAAAARVPALSSSAEESAAARLAVR